MCIRDRRLGVDFGTSYSAAGAVVGDSIELLKFGKEKQFRTCLLYTSDAADDLLCVDLGGRRIIKKKKKNKQTMTHKIESIRAPSRRKAGKDTAESLD